MDVYSGLGILPGAEWASGKESKNEDRVLALFVILATYMGRLVGEGLVIILPL